MSIKISDLRIGNWVRHKSNWSYRQERGTFIEFDFQIQLMDFVAFSECTLSLDDIEPIPLTEEWLIKFGFVITRTQAYKIFNDFGDQVKLNKIGNEFEFVYLAVPIKYAHQLQNLYFALTGEELTIKE